MSRVVSDELWRGTFAIDPRLVGKRIALNRTAFTVVLRLLPY
jgi:hypothetical protein